MASGLGCDASKRRQDHWVTVFADLTPCKEAMTVGGVRTNQLEVMNWLRLHVDGAQSESLLCENQESSSNVAITITSMP